MAVSKSSEDGSKFTNVEIRLTGYRRTDAIRF